MPDEELLAPSDYLNKLSEALVQISRGDPLVALRNELVTRFAGIETRFEAIDKATALQHEDAVRIPTQIDRAISGLRDFIEQLLETKIEEMHGKLNTHIGETNERFTQVNIMFVESDKRNQQLKAAEALALAAALQAAKEAVAEQNRSNTLAINKSEIAVGESLKQILANVQVTNQSMTDKIDDIKSRQDKGEGSNTALVATGSAIIAVMSLILAGYIAFHTPQYIPSPLSNNSTSSGMAR